MSRLRRHNRLAAMASDTSANGGALQANGTVEGGAMAKSNVTKNRRMFQGKGNYNLSVTPMPYEEFKSNYIESINEPKLGVPLNEEENPNYTSTIGIYVSILKRWNKAISIEEIQNLKFKLSQKIHTLFQIAIKPIKTANDLRTVELQGIAKVASQFDPLSTFFFLKARNFQFVDNISSCFVNIRNIVSDEKQKPLEKQLFTRFLQRLLASYLDLTSKFTKTNDEIQGHIEYLYKLFLLPDLIIDRVSLEQTIGKVFAALVDTEETSLDGETIWKRSIVKCIYISCACLSFWHHLDVICLEALCFFTETNFVFLTRYKSPYYFALGNDNNTTPKRYKPELVEVNTTFYNNKSISEVFDDILSDATKFHVILQDIQYNSFQVGFNTVQISDVSYYDVTLKDNALKTIVYLQNYQTRDLNSPNLAFMPYFPSTKFFPKKKFNNGIIQDKNLFLRAQSTRGAGTDVFQTQQRNYLSLNNYFVPSLKVNFNSEAERNSALKKPINFNAIQSALDDVIEQLPETNTQPNIINQISEKNEADDGLADTSPPSGVDELQQTIELYNMLNPQRNQNNQEEPSTPLGSYQKNPNTPDTPGTNSTPKTIIRTLTEALKTDEEKAQNQREEEERLRRQEEERLRRQEEERLRRQEENLRKREQERLREESRREKREEGVNRDTIIQEDELRGTNRNFYSLQNVNNYITMMTSNPNYTEENKINDQLQLYPMQHYEKQMEQEELTAAEKRTQLYNTYVGSQTEFDLENGDIRFLEPSFKMSIQGLEQSRTYFHELQETEWWKRQTPEKQEELEDMNMFQYPMSFYETQL